MVATSSAWRAPARSAPVPGLSFRLNASVRVGAGETAPDQASFVVRGRGVAANNMAHIELLTISPQPDNYTLDDYIVARDSNRAFLIHPSKKSYSDVSETYAGPALAVVSASAGGGRGAGGRGAGRPGGGGPPGGGFGGRGGAGGGRGGGNAAGGNRAGGGRRGRGTSIAGWYGDLQMRNVSLKLDTLGAGEAIEGRATQHYKFTADYDNEWGGQQIHTHAVSEVWTTNLTTNIPNPFDPTSSGPPATEGPHLEYTLRLMIAKRKMDGTPIKVVTTTTVSGLDQVDGVPGLPTGGDPPVKMATIVQTTEITNIKEAQVDDAQLVIPDGFDIVGP